MTRFVCRTANVIDYHASLGEVGGFYIQFVLFLVRVSVSLQNKQQFDEGTVVKWEILENMRTGVVLRWK